MKVKEESEKKGLKLNIQKTKIMAVRPITSWQIDGETMETVTDFIFLDSKVTAGGNFSLEIKRCLLLERKAIINLESVLKSRHYFASKDLYSQSYGFSIALGFPGGLDGRVCLQCGRPGFDPWARKIPWRRKWQHTPVFLPGKSHGQRSLTVYSLWNCKESDMTERLHFLCFYGFSSSHVWMWVLDHKEGWMPKNWCFWTVVLEKTLESPLDCKEIKPVHPKRDQSWVFIGRTDAEAEAPVIWPPDAKN